mgnify:CR=1 FL=1
MNTEAFNSKQFLQEWVDERRSIYDKAVITCDGNIAFNPMEPGSFNPRWHPELGGGPSVFYQMLMDYKNEIPDLCDVNYFVETGTFSGITAMAYAEAIDHVHTAEIRPWDEYKAIKSKHDNITFWGGDSVAFLKKLLPTIPDERCIFLLDAHDGISHVPIVEELECIRDLSNVNNHIIIIDDCTDCGQGNFPDWGEIERNLRIINSDYKVKRWEHDARNFRQPTIAYPGPWSQI